ncbi:hypothetical protein BDK51DRAFT_30447 [Blyttiomyces helicus]|uniref:Uncharacterized protein n=1 Tax=Blyttiomyces helicus TaxID=388810 RepID=A0A4P9W4U4_9FUNG|nr:hypothetical protein BDK51DRAFT_30447 [Blyttiomyces helicus]|eukprot:RKO87379.1 hypothetical protein BDK51DRAFT_30447 [Blyttiomyces helicus]
MFRNIDAARATIQNMKCPDFQNETNDKAKPLLAAALDNAIDAEEFAAYILSNKSRLTEVSNDFWLFYLLVRAQGGRTPQPSPSSSPAVARAADVRAADVGIVRRKSMEGWRGWGSDALRVVGGSRGLKFEYKREQGASFPSQGGSNWGVAGLQWQGDSKASSFKTMIERFAPSLSVDFTKIDELNNVFTLTSPAHMSFGSFQWVVEDINNEWVIRVLDSKPSVRRDDAFKRDYIVNNDITTRQSVFVHDLPLLCDRANPQAPLSKYFKLHAALGRVLYASGRADELQDIFEHDNLGSLPEKTRESVESAIREMTGKSTVWATMQMRLRWMRSFAAGRVVTGCGIDQHLVQATMMTSKGSALISRVLANGRLRVWLCKGLKVWIEAKSGAGSKIEREFPSKKKTPGGLPTELSRTSSPHRRRRHLLEYVQLEAANSHLLKCQKHLQLSIPI